MSSSKKLIEDAIKAMGCDSRMDAIEKVANHVGLKQRHIYNFLNGTHKPKKLVAKSLEDMVKNNSQKLQKK